MTETDRIATAQERMKGLFHAKQVLDDLRKDASTGGRVPPLTKITDFRARWVLAQIEDPRLEFASRNYFRNEFRMFPEYMQTSAQAYANRTAS